MPIHPDDRSRPGDDDEGEIGPLLRDMRREWKAMLFFLACFALLVWAAAQR